MKSAMMTKYFQSLPRFPIGAAAAFLLCLVGALCIEAVIPTWGATGTENTMQLPGDEVVANPQIIWNHAITIHANPEQIYPWLAQMGDTRAGFYSITFIENVFQTASGASYRYKNADRIHPEWQNPIPGQGIIADLMTFTDFQTNRYLLAQPTDEVPVKWTWVWYLHPIDQNSTRLIIRHRASSSEIIPSWVFKTIFNAGFIMERSMMLGIKDRVEGHVPSPIAEPLGAAVWLGVLTCGIIAAVQFVCVPNRYPVLGVGLASIAVLFLLTYLQPSVWVRFGLLVILVMFLAFQKGKRIPKKEVIK
jgi:hypothetical protein